MNFCSGASAIRCAQEAWKQHDFNRRSNRLFLLYKETKRRFGQHCVSEKKKLTSCTICSVTLPFFSICRHHHHGELMIIGAIKILIWPTAALQKWILIYTFHYYSLTWSTTRLLAIRNKKRMQETRDLRISTKVTRCGLKTTIRALKDGLIM